MGIIVVWLWLLSVAVAVGILLVITKLQRFERTGSELAAGLLLATLPFVFVAGFGLPLTVGVAVLHMWLLVLPARLFMGRLEQQFLQRGTRINAVAGLGLAVGIVLLYMLPAGWLQPHMFITLWLAACVCACLFFLGQMLWNTRHYKLRVTDDAVPLKEMPTVSICIPARNEDHALADCLQAALASDYPKLEILVLDDCSQDNTSTIIRSFAHDGVRFVQGDQPAVGWLGKNQAMQTLAQQASGDYILFLDVDTHLAPQTISRLMRYSAENKLEMTSVLPQNRLGIAPATLFGSLEYFWRISLPITRHHVPVSSRMWLINAASLKRLGGFASVGRKIVPEASFARRLAKAYRFLVADAALGITTAKRWPSEIEAAIRVSYPELRRQPLMLLGACVLLVGLCIAPFVAAITAAITADTSITAWLSYAAVGLLIVNYYLVVIRTQPHNWLLAGLLWPVVAMQNVVILVASMLMYEFGEVNWKGRNVCYPVLAPQPQAWHQALQQRR